MELIDRIKRLKKPDAPWLKYYKKDERSIKVKDKTIYEYFEDAANKYQDLYAIEYFTTKYKYKELLHKIDKTAKALYKIGIRRNDVVTICSANIPEAIISFYAVNKLGAIANMIHPLSSEDEIKNYLIKNHTKLLIMMDICYEKIKNIIDETKVKRVIVISAKDSMRPFLKIGYVLTKQGKIKRPKASYKYTYWHKFIKEADFIKNVKTVTGKKDTPAVLLHSGGTTGEPKGILLSNGNFSGLVEQFKIILKNVNPRDNVLGILPLFHGFGLGVNTHTGLCLGTKLILVPQFNSHKFDELVNKTKPNLILGVPTLFEALITSNNIKDLDLSYLKYAVSGGDKLPDNLEKDVNNYLKKHHANIKITQGYGMTESLAATALSFGKAQKKGSMGIPFPSNYYKIVDPNTGEDLGPYQDGEICVNGPTVMLGYLDNEIATNEVLRIHKDGYMWLHTGDIGYMDKDGVFFYKTRLKRMIISSGFNVYPSYIESIINQHPAVLTSTVIGIPHPYKVEVPKAFIVLKNGYHGLNPKASIKKFCEKHLSKHSVPYEYEFRKSLPKTLIGKIDYKKLMQEEEEKRKHDNIQNT